MDIQQNNVINQVANDEDIQKQKYDTFLCFINYVLKQLNKDEINSIDQFKNISRNELTQVDLETDKIWTKWFFKTFDKKEFQHYSRGKKKNYILTIFRKGCMEVNMQFKLVKKTKMENRQLDIKFYYI